MLRGLYTATAGMITQQRKHDTVTNNIANANTPGYKQNQTAIRSFPETLIFLMRGEPGQTGAMPIGNLHQGIFAEENLPVFVQGDMQETNNPLDFAILSDLQVPGVQFDGFGKGFTPEGTRVFQPQAFFTVQNQDGDRRYTRNGKFTISNTGELVTAEGYRMLGQDGQPISLVNPDAPNQTHSIRVGSKGELLDAVAGTPLVDAAGNPRSLLITRVANPHQLIQEGYGVFRLDGDAVNNATVIAPEDRFEIRQGYVERSNVDPIQSMVDMMTAARAYEANQKVIQAYDRSLEKAANEVGRV